MLHAAFVRSPHAHAGIRSIDVARALARPGVAAVLIGGDVDGAPLVDRMRLEGLAKTPQPILATDRVRFVGEPVAVVLADSRYLAEDAAEHVDVDYEPLAVVADVEQAMADGAPLLFDGLGSNVVYRRSRTLGEVEAAFREADRVFSQTYHGNRFAAAPLETRGCLADYDPATGAMTVWSSTQCPHLLRNRLARALDFPEHKLRIIAPDVGGGFGQKIPMQPEEGVVAAAARRLGRPVRWAEDRRENLVAGTHAKEQLVRVEVAVRSDGTLLGLKAVFVGDAGAYSFNSASALIEPYLASVLMPSVYRLVNYELEVLAVVTNKSPVAPYRGVGWTAGHSAREILFDRVARKLGIDPADFRRRNMIRSGELPFLSCTGMLYDSGSYVESLELALEAVDYERLRDEQAALREQGRYLGIGISPYVEPTGWGSEGGAQASWPFASHDSASVSVDPSGKVSVAISVSPHGQGHETSLAQIVADILDVDLADVAVVHSDTTATPFGIGTRASRSAVVAGGALALAAQQVRTRLLRIAAILLEADPSDLEQRDGTIQVRGVPERAVGLAQVAEAAYFSPAVRAHEPEPMLTATSFYDPRATYSNGCIVAVCEVDAETGLVTLRRVVAAEDCGRMLNPLIVDGQVHGAVAQGIGGALYEELAYDRDGQMLTGSFLDYLLPTATEVPDIAVAHIETPSPFTVGGIKGMGESGVIATPAAVANAVQDALAPFGARVTGMPLTPDVVRRLARSTQASSPNEFEG